MRSALLLTALAAASVLLGCGRGEQKAVRAPCPSGEACLEMGVGAEPTSLDPHRSSGTWERQIISDMLVGLTDADAAGEPVPGMATHWTTSADALTWTFFLRDAKWSDGVPVTADDFVAGLRRIVKPELAAEYAALVYPIKNAAPINEGKLPPEQLGVRAIDRRTVEITLEHPAPYLPYLLLHHVAFPVPKHMVDKYGDDDWMKPGNYVANGPYKLVSWSLGDRVVVVKNPLYWEADKLCFTRIHYYPTEDRISGERQVLSGTLDTHTPLVQNRIAYLRREYPQYLRTHQSLSTQYLFFNNTLPMWKDRRVRLALSMAVDRDFMTTKVRGMGEPAAYSFVPPGMPNYTPLPPPEWASWPLEKRQAEARRLLSEAGYGPKKPLKFEFMMRGYDPTGTYAAVQADWKQIGVQAVLNTTETQIAYQNYQIRDYVFGEAGWVADFPDAMNFLYLLDSKTGAHNYGGYNNPAYDALLAQANLEPDVQKRAAILRQAEQLMLDDIPIIPLFTYVTSNVTSPKLSGMVENPGDTHRARYMCKAELKK